MKSFLPTLTAAFLALSSASASDFPEVYNSEPDKAANPPGPEEALAMWKLPEGFSVNLYAAEPEIRNPIAMAWDGRGRMWVAENYTYAERQTRFALDLKDRVLIFEDSDGDGKADERKVFLEDVQMLTSVEVGRGGVWLMCPPQLLFVPDRDGDDVPDGAPEVVLDGFDVAQANYHNFANGLRWGPDGWLYGRCGHSCPGKVGKPGTPEERRTPIEGGIWRYQPGGGRFEVLTHGTTNPWGHDWDRHGELFFINTVNGHLWHGIPGAHFTESFGADPNPLVYHRIDTHADHYHYDTTGSWTDSRDGAANAFGGGHAHIGMMIYQGDSWPETFYDRLLTLNMHGRRANVERLERVGGGFVGRHEPDVFLMGDEWFRGIEIQPGPDGAVYVLDWSDTGECHEHTGVHRTSGRIYRIAYGEEQDSDVLDVLAAARGGDADAARKLLARSDPWGERQLRAFVRDSIGTGSEPAGLEGIAREVFDGEEEPFVRLRALWMLHQYGAAGPEILVDQLGDPNENLRSWAVRLLVDGSPIDSIMGPVDHAPALALSNDILARFVGLAKDDPSGLVRLTLASALQRMPVGQREVLGTALASRTEDAADHNLPAMVWYGVSPLAKSEPDALVRMAGETEWPDLLRWIARSIALQTEERPAPLDALLSSLAESEQAVQMAVLGGISDAFKGWRKAPAPASWGKVVDAIGEGGSAELAVLVRDLGTLFGDGRALDEVRATALDGTADHAMRKAALETLIDARPDDLREVCEKLLDDRLLNIVAVKGLSLFDDPSLGEELAKRYRRFYPAERPAVIEVLVSRPVWAKALLKRIAAEEIPKSDLSAFQARQIRAFGDEALSSELARVWGDVRESSEDKRRLIEEWTAKLTDERLADADLARGRQLSAAICGACHVMYGEGGKIGPDLTGSNRSDLGYLLENIIDPGAVVSADYQMTILTTKDGRVLTGVVAAESDRTLTLRQTAAEAVVEKAEIEKREVAEVSMMPEGLLLAFDEDQVRDLIAYLKHPVQVALPGE